MSPAPSCSRTPIIPEQPRVRPAPATAPLLSRTPAPWRTPPAIPEPPRSRTSPPHSQASLVFQNPPSFRSSLESPCARNSTLAFPNARALAHTARHSRAPALQNLTDPFPAPLAAEHTACHSRTAPGTSCPQRKETSPAIDGSPGRFFHRFPVACAFLHIPTNFHIEQKRSGSFRLRFFDILQKVVVLDNLYSFGRLRILLMIGICTYFTISSRRKQAPAAWEPPPRMTGDPARGGP